MSQDEFAHSLGIPPGIRHWILHDLTPMSRREAKAKAPWNFAEHIVALRIVDSMSWYYSCRHFDVETRLCGVFEDRPKPCRDYPWAGETPEPSTALPPPCSGRHQQDGGAPTRLACCRPDEEAMTSGAIEHA